MKIYQAFVIFFVIFFVISIGKADPRNWKDIDTATNEFLYGIYFLDDRQGWIVYKDSCFITTDSGVNWNAVSVTEKSSTPLYDVTFIESGILGISIGFATSSDGFVYKSSSSGENWVPINTDHPGISFFGISYIKDFGNHAWIVGTPGTIAYSSNNGSSWETQYSGPNGLNDVYFIDRNLGWAVGKNGTILHTDVGGRQDTSWVKQTDDSIGTTIDLHGVWFYNSQIGWIVGDNGSIFKTENGGNTWTPQNSGIESTLKKIAFSDEKNGIIVGTSGIILNTEDGGDHWEKDSNLVSANLLSVSYPSFENGWAVGAGGTLLYSQGSVELIAPVRDEALEGGAEYEIRWESTYISELKIELSTDNGQIWNLIESAVNAPIGYFGWTPPDDINSDACRIRITGATKPDVTDSSDVFTIYIPDSTGPEITDISRTLTDQGDDIELSAIITDPSGVSSANLFYRLAGKAVFEEPIEMRPEGQSDIFTGIIPWPGEQDGAGLQGYQYYIKAVDASFNGNDSTSPPSAPEMGLHDISIKITEFTKREIKSSTLDSQYYQMFSIPLQFLENDGSIDSILVPNFGPYDSTQWRLYRWNTNEAKSEEYLRSSIGNFEPGKAFWLITRKTAIRITNGQSVKPEMMMIPLDPATEGIPISGWNQIANPFSFTVCWDTILQASAVGESSSIDGPYWYNPEARVYERKNKMSPWEGYFVKNMTGEEITLKIPPVEALPTANQTVPSKPSVEGLQWELQLTAGAGGILEYDNYVGIHESSKSGWDNLDHREPPPVGKYISLHFPHIEWEKHADNYTTDFRPPFEDMETWAFNVQTNIDEVVEITAAGLENLPQGYEAWLLDEDLKISKNLMVENRFSIANLDQTPYKRLKLIVGKTEYIVEEINKTQLVPMEYELSQNFPNPFNNATTIRLGLPKNERVTLKVFNLLGEEVALLLNNENKTAGYYSLIWNGLWQNGQAATSGIYFYRLNVGEFMMTKKMIMIQ